MDNLDNYHIAQNQLLEDLVSKLELLYQKSDIDLEIDQLKRCFVFLINELTLIEKIHFSTFFSKVTYAANTYKISGVDLYLSHVWRKFVEGGAIEDSYDKKELGIYVLYNWIIHVDPSHVSDTLAQVQRPIIDVPEKEYVDFIASDRFIVLQIDKSKNILLGYTLSEPHLFKKVEFNVPHRNENFTRNIIEIDQYLELPVNLTILNIQVKENGVLVPDAFIVDSDFLVDVTAISECFASGSTNTIGHLTKKFVSIDISPSLILGNIANMILDELIYDVDIEFSNIAQKIFSIHPLAISKLNDEEAKALLIKAKEHFENLKKVVSHQFSAVGIDSTNSYLEPSFYSTKYGIQGRLDLYHADEQETMFDIVELKSGKPFKPNAYGLNHNHYIQTLLYDVLIRHTLPKGAKAKTYILYSSQSEQALKYAPAIKSQQYDALQIRNTIRVIEHMLANVDNDDYQDVFSFLSADTIPDSWRFVKRDLHRIQNLIKQMSSLEYDYFKQFTAFIAREHHIAKIGSSSGDSRGGFASMWCDTLEEKKMQYSSILFCQINSIKSEYGQPIIILDRSEDTDQLTKFRSGDIAVLYPHIPHAKEPLSSQVFKCTILEINDNNLTLRLRNSQQNLTFFDKYQHWHLDSDLIDSSFNSMYRSLFSFFESPVEVRNRIFGQLEPKTYQVNELQGRYDLTDNQELIAKQAVSSEDYYLIWGPPGTGKTSKVLASIVDELTRFQRQKVLVLSFTNRAVDEISHALLQQGIDQEKFLRIGSRHSCHQDFLAYLLSTKLEEVSSRSSLNSLLTDSEIVVGTVSSIMGKHQLFDIIDFDTVIVDEASQLLEPFLIGILPKVPKWILIGDHLQLPAVVTQNPISSRVKNEALNQTISLVDTRNSLFERMVNLVNKNNWKHAIGILSEQGRMHIDIMQFVNTYFYDNQLMHIPNIPRLVNTKAAILPDELKERMMFIHCDSEQDFTKPQNDYQAKEIIKLLTIYQTYFESNHIPLDTVTIGIITPFRAQIALVNSYLNHAKLKLNVNIDTVERYQGGARDIIIFSTAINHPTKFRQIVSLSTEGIDRKLNVAITRAKEQFILLGDDRVLSKDSNYSQLMKFCKKKILDS